MVIYPSDLKTIKWPPIVESYDSFVYSNYAKYHELAPGSFELIKYMETAKGIDLYQFYVVRGPNEWSKQEHRNRLKMDCETMYKRKLKRKYEGLSGTEIRDQLKEKSLPIGGKKPEKVQRLVEHELEEIVESKLSS